MTWTSKFQAGFTKPLIRQIAGILKRDMQAALDNVSGVPGSLASFAEWNLATLVQQNFPAIALLPESVEFDQESLGTLAEKIKLSVAVTVTHQDANVCAESAQDYVRAVDEVLNSAWWLTPLDFELSTLALPSPPYPAGATTPGLPALTWLFVGAHAYDELRRTRQGQFATTAKLTLVAEMEET
jgi:hypothetical protein